MATCIQPCSTPNPRVSASFSLRSPIYMMRRLCNFVNAPTPRTGRIHVASRSIPRKKKIPQKIHFVPLRGAGFDRVGTAGMKMPTRRTMRGRANTRVGGGFRSLFGPFSRRTWHRVERARGHGVLLDLPNADPRLRGRRSPHGAGLLRKDRLDDLAGDVGEAEVAALEAIGQPLVVDAEEVRGSWRAGRGRGRRRATAE